jgi:hypothetical protein
MAQTHLPEKWIERLRANLEIPQDHQTYRFFTAMQKAEGSVTPTNPLAKWNPLNTTNHVHSDAHGAWQEDQDFNSSGVCNFNHPWQGILATVDTFAQPAFADLLVALRQVLANGTTAEEIVNTYATLIKTHWGTNPQTMLDVLKTLS